VQYRRGRVLPRSAWRGVRSACRRAASAIVNSPDNTARSRSSTGNSTARPACSQPSSSGPTQPGPGRKVWRSSGLT